GADTYLVVAADKGTATFSDTANRIAQEYGFWLDDAFASGGSAGYDREALGVSESSLAPTDLIRAVLRAPVDLFWNGGIGTVVKASSETDADAADRSSDAIRVNADELRA